MFLTQQVPWAMQKALWEYGWMSVLGPVSNWEHLEIGGVWSMGFGGNRQKTDKFYIGK